ncbi:MAG: M2 family metallopeptidase [Planctomycetes bacterium]|nr:M2 family metallopeptidase [Planctomycetota bacterium]
MHTLSRRAVALSLLLAACAGPSAEDAPPARATQAPDPALSADAQGFLDAYHAEYVRLVAASAEAQWASNTHIVEGDDTNAQRTQAADEALAAFTGSVANIERARAFLARADELPDLQRRQLERVLFQAGRNPQTAPEVVKAKIAADTKQTETLYGFAFKLDGKELTPNDIDAGLRNEQDLGRRLAVWQASKDVGPALRPGLVDLQRLRNESVRALGYPDFFAYMASEYGMTTAELDAVVQKVNRELRPLFRELHTWARHELARRYGQPVPDLIPAHWLPNRWGQDWSGLVDVAGFDLDPALAGKGPTWLVQQAERFYVSLGFTPLPPTFWTRSSLYPLAPEAGFKKNTHASAWHMDLGNDVRCLMSVEPNAEWYETTHHELGHIYYYVCYTNPQVPPLLREGANRAYHEAVGSLMGLAAMQPRFVQGVGLDTGATRPDPMQVLLKEALNYAVFIPWSAGTMFSFEKELYADELPPGRWNQRWWELVAKYQGIAPPAPRGEEWCDAATKTHINDDPAGYYDYALSFVLLFQLHDHIAREILHEDPRDTNYYGRAEVGEWLRGILTPGMTVDWDQLLREKTGEGLTAKPMLRYFEPLMGWLKEQNKGRRHALGEI